MSVAKCPHCRQFFKARPSLQSGYVSVSYPTHPAAAKNGYMYEHRIVAEQMLGRALKPGEIVHHKNGIKTDNRPKNLMVMSVSEHRKYHNFMRWHGTGAHAPKKSQ